MQISRPSREAGVAWLGCIAILLVAYCEKEVSSRRNTRSRLATTTSQVKSRDQLSSSRVAAQKVEGASGIA